MHGFSSGSIFRVNAEVDSMGVVVDGGVVSGTKPSPRRAEIERAQAELRLEYDVREERRRELEFLEKGGDPLDFKLSHAASVSVQSTSHTDPHPDQNLTSEAKGSFALTPSPHRDSVESSGQLGVTTACEPNSADNFDGENEMLQSDRKSIHPVRRNIIPSEHSSQVDRSRNVKDIEDSPVFHPKNGQLYRRRNRSKPNRDHSRSNSADMASHGGNGSSMPDRHEMLSQSVAPVGQSEMESDGTHVTQSMTSEVIKCAEGKLSLSNSKENLEVQNLRLKADEALVTIRTVEPAIVVGRDSVVTLDADCPPSSGADKIEHIATSAQLNETSSANGANCPPTDAPINTALVMTKGIESESSCSQTIVSVNGNENVDSELLTNLKNVDNIPSDGAPKEHTLPVGENSASIDHKMLSEDHGTNALAIASCIREDQSSMGYQGKTFTKEDHSEVDRGKSFLQEDVLYAEGQKKHDDTEIKSQKELDQLNNRVAKMDSSCPVQLLVEPASDELNSNAFSGQPPVLETQSCTQNQSRPQDSAEDRILEEARMIVAKRKRIAALSIGPSPKEHLDKGHWDLVLEEMAWLANDFAQERLWKTTAAAQICRHVAFASRKRFQEQSRFSKQKSVAHTLAKAVMDFWYSASLSVENAETCKLEASLGGNEKDKVSRDDFQSTRKKQDRGVCGYAVRFLQLNCQPKPFVDVEMPRITETACDNGLPELSWQDQFTEENLFYTVAPGAMEMYRKSIESCLADCERLGSHIQEEVISSTPDAAAECGYEDNDYEEDEGGHLYYQPGVLDNKKPSKKKLEKMKSYARSSELGGDFGYGNCAEIRNGTAQLNVMGKKHASNLHVDPVPMKRVRTASRQRVVGPFSAGSVGVSPVLSRADASSEDTNSFQDDKNTLHGGSIVPTGLEVDSAMNFEKQSTLDSVEMSAKHKKNKKTKHQGLSYDHRWPLDSPMQNYQKDLVRKRSDNYHLESNGNGSLFGQHAKKPKLAKHSMDNPFDHTAPMTGSVPSPVASQMSNLSSQTKLIKLIGGRDRGKKGKGLKMSNGQFGSGSPWTIVEDQALVVLVHDMGPNWELVSDAINNILQFKCIFRKPQECKERHKYLMDRPSGDGADSGEDSGSSQPYPSTLPGIPKGSARQLFRSLHAHVEEDNIKSRFEKIIRIEQQLYFRKKKNDNQDLKHIVPAHGSHILSLSQVMPNNVNGGVLTPLDLSDTSTSNQAPFSIGNQNSHAGGLQLPHQSSVSLTHSPSGLSSPHQSLQGSPSMVIGNNLASPSPSSQFTSARDARYSVPRSGSLPVEEQQRLNQYNSMLQGRNIQASNLSSSGSLSGVEKNVHMHASGNGVSVMPGMNCSIPMVRPGAQGIPSSTLNSASVLSSNMGGVPSNINMHGTASGRGNGNTLFRPRDSLHGVRAGQSAEHQRQMMSAGMQMHATQTNSPGVPPFGGLSSGFSNNQATSPLQTYPGHHHPHGAIPEQQALSRMSRERQMHQRLSHHKHQQHPTSSALMSRTQSPSQLPMSSPPSQSVPSPIIHIVQPTNVQGLGRSTQCGPGGMTSQGGKQRQQSKSQQDPKRLKIIGRNNMVIHQNLPTDPSQLNGPSSTNSASQVVEEGDPSMHLMQGQILYSGSTLNTPPTSKPVVCTPTSSLTQPQKPCVNKGPATSKPLLDGGNLGKALGSNKGLSKTVVLSRNRQQLQGQPSLKMVNQTQSAIQRKSQQNHQMNSDYLTTSPLECSLSELKSTSMGPPPACVESVGDSFKTSEFSRPGSSTSEAVTNSSSIEPLLSVSQGNNVVSRELEAQRHQQESQLSTLQPILPQKQSHVKFDQSAV